MGDLDMVELNIASAPQHPTMKIIRALTEIFFTNVPPSLIDNNTKWLGVEQEDY
jgi:hypothetical protein